MISLTPNAAIILYLAATISTLLFVWIFFHFSSAGKRAYLPYRQLYVCEFCHFHYIEDREKSVNACPQCSMLNKNNLYEKDRFN